MTDLPPGWASTTIGEVGEVMLGRQRSPKWHAGPNMRPYLRVANVFEDRIDLSDVKEMDFPPHQYERFRLEPGDILLNEGQSPEWVGRPAMYRGEMPGVCFTNSLIRFRPHSGVNGRYALFLFRHHLHSRRFMREARITTNIAHLSATRFSAVEFPLAPLNEQERIVAAIEEHLSRLDAASAGLARAVGRLERLQDAFIESVTSVGPEVPLERYAEPDGITDGPFGSKLKTAHYTSAGPRVLRLENIGVGEFLDQRTHISAEYFSELARYEAVSGDLVVASLVSDRLRACVVPDRLGPAIVKADCIRVRPRPGTDTRFLNYALMRRSLASFVAENSRGVGRVRLGLANVRKLPVPDASPEAQRRIADALESELEILQQARSAAGQVAARSSSLRRAILAAAFSGKLVPQDPDDEPASVILERIRAGRAVTSRQ